MRVSATSETPDAAATRRCTSAIRASTSSADPPGSAWTKLACFVDTSAVPWRRPLQPAASIRRPAESPGGFVNTDPAFWPPGWLARRQATISDSVRSPAPRSPAARPSVAATTTWVAATAERR